MDILKFLGAILPISIIIKAVNYLIKNKMAHFRCETDTGKSDFYRGYFNVYFHFINDGKSDAKNVRIEMLPPENEIDKEKFLKFANKYKLGPYELINSNSEKIDNSITSNILSAPKTLKIKITWNDGFRNNRHQVFSVDLY